MKKNWWKEAVVYQIYPKSFADSNGDGIGDLNGITQHLDYLKDLGVDVLWLNPIYDSPMVDNGYDIRNYRKINEEFGTMEDFDRLLSEVHKRGMKLVMDLVVNHSSDQNPWFIESKKSKDNPYRDYYIWRDAKGEAGKNKGEDYPNNWISWFSGPAWQYDPDTDQYYLHLFDKKMPDLNWENPKVREEVFDMMDSWFQKGVDGFRMDVITLVSKYPSYSDGEGGNFVPFVANGPRIHEFLREMNEKVLKKYDTMTVGEGSCMDVENALLYANEDDSELKMMFQFEMTDLDNDENGKWTDKKMKLSDIKRIMTRWQDGLYGHAWNALFWDNHDQPRVVSRLGDEGLHREKSAKMLGLCLHMMWGTPYIYYGEELGMTGYAFDQLEDIRDVESLNAYHDLVGRGKFTHEEMMHFIGKRGRDACRTPMQWANEKNAGFSEGEPWLKVNPNYVTINAASQVNDENSVFSFYKNLIRIRKEKAIVVYGRYELLPIGGDAVYAYTREWEGEKFLILCNFTNSEQALELDDMPITKGKTVISTDYKSGEVIDLKNMKLAPYEGSCFQIMA